MTTKTAKFTEMDRRKATAIVNVFETGRPFGEYDALAVLNDGAGISYGVSQFTHRSGSLYAVVRHYLENGGTVGRVVLEENLKLLRSTTPKSIASAAGNRPLRNALMSAASTALMRASQNAVAYDRYLRLATEACEGSGFTLPLSLAVVYDSINHGSWKMIRDRVRIPVASRPGTAFERAWITAYVKARHNWLRSVPRLKSTSYRTAFFLAQIVAGNWDLKLPMTVHGVTLSAKNFPPAIVGDTTSAAGHPPIPSTSPDGPPEPSVTGRRKASPANARPPKTKRPEAGRIREELADLLAKYDRIESIAGTILTRTDAAKSLWTTVAGTLWQTFWAIASFLIGLPRELWLAVAVIAAVLTIIYLYRQFALGRIREMRGPLYLTPKPERPRKLRAREK